MKMMLKKQPPYDVIQAAELVSRWFATHNIKEWELGGCRNRKDAADPFEELKAAAKDPTKEILCTKDTDPTWYGYGTVTHGWDFECAVPTLPPSDYKIRDKSVVDPYAGLKVVTKDQTKLPEYYEIHDKPKPMKQSRC